MADRHCGSEGDHNGTDIPAVIYDIDGDGDNDVLAVMENEFRIFEGATGASTRSFPLPHPEAHDPLEVAGLDRVDRTPQNARDSLYLVFSTGETLWKEQRPTVGCFGTVMEPLHAGVLPGGGVRERPGLGDGGPRRSSPGRGGAGRVHRSGAVRADHTDAGAWAVPAGRGVGPRHGMIHS